MTLEKYARELIKLFDLVSGDYWVTINPFFYKIPMSKCFEIKSLYVRVHCNKPTYDYGVKSWNVGDMIVEIECKPRNLPVNLSGYAPLENVDFSKCITKVSIYGGEVT